MNACGNTNLQNVSKLSGFSNKLYNDFWINPRVFLDLSIFIQSSTLTFSFITLNLRLQGAGFEPAKCPEGLHLNLMLPLHKGWPDLKLLSQEITPVLMAYQNPTANNQLQRFATFSSFHPGTLRYVLTFTPYCCFLNGPLFLLFLFGNWLRLLALEYVYGSLTSNQ